MRLRALFASLVAPFAVTALVLGCPRDHAAQVDAAPSVSASAPAAVVSTSASPSWPKTVVVPEPPPPTFDELEEDASVEASLEDAPLDAPDGDAAKDGAKHDANDDAPLMGAKTYPDENPMKGIRRITSAAALVHKAPKDHDIIATLPKGTEISLVAEIFDWYRVRYADPNTNIRRQGWIYVTTFAGPRSKTCPVGWTWHPQDGGWCDKECTKNTDCKGLKGYKCSGTLCFYAAD